MYGRLASSLKPHYQALTCIGKAWFLMTLWFNDVAKKCGLLAQSNFSILDTTYALASCSQRSVMEGGIQVGEHQSGVPLFYALHHLQKKVMPSAQGSQFCGVLEKRLVGSLTSNFEEADF